VETQGDSDGYCICFSETFLMDCIIHTPPIQSVAYVITFHVMILTMLGKTELVISLLGRNEKLWTILLVMFSYKMDT
jgi:hypothetical protein